MSLTNTNEASNCSFTCSVNLRVTVPFVLPIVVTQVVSDTPTVELPTDEPHLKIHRVMTENTKSKFGNLIY